MTSRADGIYVLPRDGQRVAFSTGNGLPRVGEFVSIGTGAGAQDYVVTRVRRVHGDVDEFPPPELHMYAKDGLPTLEIVFIDLEYADARG